MVRYLRRLGKNTINLTADHVPSRNRLFIEDNDIFDDDNSNDNDNIDDDDDGNDKYDFPLHSRLQGRLQKRAKVRTTERRRASFDSDDDDDDVSPELLVPSLPCVPDSSTEDSNRLSSFSEDTPIDTNEASIEQELTNEDNSPAISYGSDDDDFIGHHSNVSSTYDALRAVRSETSPQSRVHQPDSTITYVDPVHGRHTGSREGQSLPALISEQDMEYAIGSTVSDDSDWLINDLAGRPLKRRRTTKQATLGKSLQLSRKRPAGSGFSKKTSKSHSSSVVNRAARPKQTRLEVVSLAF